MCTSNSLPRILGARPNRETGRPSQFVLGHLLLVERDVQVHVAVVPVVLDLFQPKTQNNKKLSLKPGNRAVPTFRCSPSAACSPRRL